jgi:hypothetical protein
MRPDFITQLASCIITLGPSSMPPHSTGARAAVTELCSPQKGHALCSGW